MGCWGPACSSLGDSGHDSPLLPPQLRGYPGYWGGGYKGLCTTCVGQVYATCLGQGIPVCYSAPSPELCPSTQYTFCPPSFNLSYSFPANGIDRLEGEVSWCASVSIPPFSAQAPIPSPTQSSRHLIPTKRKCHLTAELQSSHC